MEQEIIAIYKDENIKVKDILKQYNIHFRTLNRILKENHISRRRESINNETKSNILKDFRNQITIREITKKYKVTYKTVYKILEDFDVTIKISPKGIKTNRKYKIDYDIFKRRDKEVAYFCGLLASDGTISKNGNIKLSMIDYEIVSKLCNFFNLPNERIYEIELKHEKWNLKKQYRIDICHYGFLTDLEYWGIIPNKTYNYIEPKIEINLLSSFLRGVFDGDGHLGFDKKSNNPRIFQITGNTKSLEYYKKSFERLGFKDSIIINKTTDVHGVLYITGQEKIRQILNLLKGEPNLNRKWNSINEWLIK